jgi:hypothetical protein
MKGRIKAIRRPITEWMSIEYELDSRGIKITQPEDVIRQIGTALVEVELENGDVKNGTADGMGRVSFW